MVCGCGVGGFVLVVCDLFVFAGLVVWVDLVVVWVGFAASSVGFARVEVILRGFLGVFACCGIGII